MNDTAMDELGPIDYLVVEFPAGKAAFSGEMGDKLKALVAAGTIRVLDMLIITKEADGAVDAFEVHDFEGDDVGALREFGAELAELLSEEDVGHMAAALEPGTVAAALVWENTWAAPFASSIRRSGGQLVASGRIPMQAILAAVEAHEGVAQTEGA
jgi:fructosamine-3-kinase